MIKGKHFMVQAQAQRRRSWAGMVWLGVVAFGVLIAVVYGYTSLLLLAGSIAVALTIVLSRRTTRLTAPARVSWRPMEQRSIFTAEGATQSALVAPIERSDGYEMVLTVD